MQHLLLFLEGIITFISPCLLPMLPLYVSYFAAGESGRRKALINAIGFVVGFTLMFVAMGAFAGTIGRFFKEYTVAFNIITGLIVVIFGLNFMGLLKIGLLNRSSSRSANVKNLGFFSSLLFGFVFSIGWTPCVGAFLGSALMAAAQSGSVLQGIIMLLVYSLGLGIPFILSAVLIDRLKSTIDFIKKNYRTFNIISGVLLLVIGILMMSGLMGQFLSLLTF